MTTSATAGFRDCPSDPVASTAVLVAAIRAKESARDDRLFDDPFADRLAGDAGRETLERLIAAVGEQSISPTTGAAS